MANFNTYQTRHFYVAKAIDSNVDTAGDINFVTTANGKAFFSYRNADGLLTASDVFDLKNITSLRMTEAAEMDIPLMAHTIAVDSSAVTLSNLVGKTISMAVTFHQVLSYDMSDTYTVVATVVGNATNTASNAAFYKAMAKALVGVMPKLPEAPFKVYIGSTEITKALPDASYPGSGDFVIVQAPQKWIRGKMSNEPYELSVAFNVGGLADPDIAWGTDTVAPSNISGLKVIPSAYQLADLEYFALGERGDIYRGNNWPNNYDTNYQIDVTKEYNVLNIEYFWQGGAENVQKSPRMIQVVAEATDSSDIITTLFGQVADAAGIEIGSGS